MIVEEIEFKPAVRTPRLAWGVLKAAADLPAGYLRGPNVDWMLEGVLDDLPALPYVAGSFWMDGVEHAVCSGFGVCDGEEQFVRRYDRVLRVDPRAFVVVLQTVTPTSDPGWRWHKWGPYVGEKTPTAEHLGDETGIDQVTCFSVVQVTHPDDRGKKAV